jgi:hypothetical protein
VERRYSTQLLEAVSQIPFNTYSCGYSYRSAFQPSCIGAPLNKIWLLIKHHLTTAFCRLTELYLVGGLASRRPSFENNELTSSRSIHSQVIGIVAPKTINQAVYLIPLGYCFFYPSYIVEVFSSTSCSTFSPRLRST